MRFHGPCGTAVSLPLSSYLASECSRKYLKGLRFQCGCARRRMHCVLLTEERIIEHDRFDTLHVWIIDKFRVNVKEHRHILSSSISDIENGAEALRS